MLREYLKRRILSFLLRSLENETITSYLNESTNKNQVELPPLRNTGNPYYPANSKTSEDTHAARRSDIVFITSRFRSGSTLLWNIFRNTPDCTSYYEPFNERKWFDSSTRGEHVDGSHIGVGNYWLEYDGMTDLIDFYQESWIRDDLYMGQTHWDPLMKKFIIELVKRANGRPVLQFNRIDFRLPWLRQNFPNSKVVHLYRNPRDQWCSFLTDKQLMNKLEVATNYRDAFYLDIWCKDLTKNFPFLDSRKTPHPYARFYYLWKLSLIFGRQYSDHSISYENLSASPESEVGNLFKTLNWDSPALAQSYSVVQSPELDKWKSYAESEWFAQHEYECEQTLSEFLNQCAGIT